VRGVLSSSFSVRFGLDGGCPRSLVRLLGLESGGPCILIVFCGFYYCSCVGLCTLGGLHFLYVLCIALCSIRI